MHKLTPTGRLLVAHLTNRKWSLSSMTQRLHLSREDTVKLLYGGFSMTLPLANKIATALQTSATDWLYPTAPVVYDEKRAQNLLEAFEKTSSPPLGTIPPLGVLTCGGTISFRHGDGEVVKVARQIHQGPIQAIPGPSFDSADFGAEQWTAIAKAVANWPGGPLVITHGTDTLEWTAAALAAAGLGAYSPVVLTGSNIPLGDPNSDAAVNLQAALDAAEFLPVGVWVVFSDGDSVTISEGGWVTKTSGKTPYFRDVLNDPYATLSHGVVTVHRLARRLPSPARHLGFVSPHIVKLQPDLNLLTTPPGKLVCFELFISGSANMNFVEHVAKWTDSSRVVAACPAPIAQTYKDIDRLSAIGVTVCRNYPFPLATCLVALNRYEYL